MIITFVIIFTILSAVGVIVKEALQGFHPSNSEETRRLYYRRQFVCSSYQYQVFLEEKGEEKSENLLSRSPLEKPDTQTSLLKDQCISVIFRNYYFK